MYAYVWKQWITSYEFLTEKQHKENLRSLTFLKIRKVCGKHMITDVRESSETISTEIRRQFEFSKSDSSGFES